MNVEILNLMRTNAYISPDTIHMYCVFADQYILTSYNAWIHGDPS